MRRSNSPKDAIGFYCEAFVQGIGRYVIKVLEVDEENSETVHEIISGPRKGMKARGRYLRDHEFLIYEESELVLALLKEDD